MSNGNTYFLKDFIYDGISSMLLWRLLLQSKSLWLRGPKLINLGKTTFTLVHSSKKELKAQPPTFFIH